MFKLAQQSRFRPNLILSLLIFALLWIGSRSLAQLIPVIPLGFLRENSLLQEAYRSSGRKIINCGAIILSFFLWVRFVEKRRIRTIGFSSSGFLKKYILGFILGLSVMGTITLALAALGVVHIEAFPTSIGSPAVISIVIMALGWVIQSASEEIAIRGWLFPVIGAKYNVPLAMFVTSVIFGLLHLFNPNATALSFINLVLSGVIFNLYVLWEGSLWGVCGYHFAWNWSLANIFGFSVSGFAPVGGSLIKTQNITSGIITGGYFGPEGSILLTLFLIVGIAILLWLMQRRKGNGIAV